MCNADGKPAVELSVSDTAAGPPFSRIKRGNEVFPLLATRKTGGCEPMGRMLIFAPWERRRSTSSVLECVMAVMRGGYLPIKAKKLIEIDETTISIRFLNKKLLDF